MFNRLKRSSRLAAVICSAAITLSSSAVTAPAVTSSAASSDLNNYARLLQYSLYFYDANMCGDLADDCKVSWRGNCHTNDAVVGGFHDAGDHVKFGLPAGYTASTLGWSYYEFKDAFTETGQADHLRTITDRFAKYFRDCTTLTNGQVSNFIYQIGEGNYDHDYWGPPEKQNDNSRIAYSTTNSASDIAAEYAAALAVNYLNFNNPDDLTYAKALYEFSTRYNSITTIGLERRDGNGLFYDSTSLPDDQAWAAGWLYLATNNEQYKNDCFNKLNYVGWYYNWNNADFGVAALYGHITGDWSRMNDNLNVYCTGSNYHFALEWGSARYNTALQMCALIGEKNSNISRKDWCKNQMNYILGSNPANTCFVVGFADNSAKYPHHRGASGYYNVDIAGYSQYHPSSGHTLTGSLVGGPTTSGGDYNDAVNDYKANEVALDYNAGLVGAAAGLYHFYKTGSTDETTVIPGINDTPTYQQASNDTTPVIETTTTTTTATIDYSKVSTYTTPVNPYQSDTPSGRTHIWYFNVEPGYPITVKISGVGNNTYCQGTFGYMGSVWTQDDWVDTSSDNTLTRTFNVPEGIRNLQFQLWFPTDATLVEAYQTFPMPTDITGYYASLGDVIKLNFSVYAKQDGTYTYTIGDSDPVTGALTAGNQTVSVPVVAKSMTDDITLKVDAGNTDTVTSSVRKYADAVLAGDYDDSTKSLVKAMLDYGGKSQVYFTYKTESLANSGINYTAPAAAESFGSGITLDNPDFPEDMKYAGMTLMLQSDTSVRLYFKSDNTVYTSAEGVVQKGNYYYISTAGFRADKLSGTQTVTVAGRTVRLSPMMYVNSVLSGDPEDEPLCGVCAALRAYGYEAQQYKNAH